MNRICEFLENHEALLLALSMSGALGFFVFSVMLSTILDDYVGPYTASFSCIICVAYMVSILFMVEDYPMSKWWAINVIIWGPATYIVIIVLMVREIAGELC